MNETEFEQLRRSVRNLEDAQAQFRMDLEAARKDGNPNMWEEVTLDEMEEIERGIYHLVARLHEKANGVSEKPPEVTPV